MSGRIRRISYFALASVFRPSVPGWAGFFVFYVEEARQATWPTSAWTWRVQGGFGGLIPELTHEARWLRCHAHHPADVYRLGPALAACHLTAPLAETSQLPSLLSRTRYSRAWTPENLKAVESPPARSQLVLLSLRSWGHRTRSLAVVPALRGIAELVRPGAGHRVIAALSSSRAIHIVLDHQHPRTPRLSAVSEGENDESRVNRKADVNPHIVLSWPAHGCRRTMGLPGRTRPRKSEKEPT